MYENFSKLLEQSGKKAIDVSRATGIPSSTFSDWKKGKSSPKQDKLQKIADFFGVSIEYLMTGKKDNEKDTSLLTRRDEKEINDILSNTELLLQQEGLMFDGDPASPEAIDSILAAMKIGMELAKQKNKEKYTPKKYQ